MHAHSSSLERMFPLVKIVREYNGQAAKGDLIAALTVALFTIPQAMAYALIAGFSPSMGIMTAVVASILGAAFGSSEFLINGPTNAISVMLAANATILASQGDPAKVIVLLTLMIGVTQVLAAALRLGSFTRFVSEPVLTGFTAGAGLYVAVNQVPSLLGLTKKTVIQDLWGWVPPHNVVFDFVRAVMSLGRTNMLALTAGLATIFLIRGLQWAEPRLKRRIPAPFLAVALISLTSWALGLGEPGQGALKLALVRDIEPVVRQLPHLVRPVWEWNQIQALLGPAFAIGMLGSVEAIAIGKVLAGKVGHSFDASRQLLGEGLCNVGAAAIGGFASSGSFTRSAVNFESGAVTRLSCIFSGIMVLVIVMLFAPAANYIPIPVLAGTLIHIGLKLVNIGQFKLMIETTISDRIVLLTTFLSVLLARHLEYALFMGIAVSLFQALRRAEGFKMALIQEDGEGNLIEAPLLSTHQPTEVLALDLQGELFFAAAEVLELRLRRFIKHGTRFMVLRLTQAYNMDATTAEALAHVAKEARAHGGRLILCGVRPGMYGTLERAGLVQRMGPESIFQLEPQLLASTTKALAYAHQLAGTPAGGTREASPGSRVSR